MSGRHDPVHTGEEPIVAEERAVGQVEAQLKATKNTLSRFVTGKDGVSPRPAIALERLRSSDEGRWITMQGALRAADSPESRVGCVIR